METAKRKAKEDEEIRNYRLLNATIPEQDRRLTKAASEKAKSVKYKQPCASDILQFFYHLLLLIIGYVNFDT